MSARETLEAAAVANGWTLTRDEGYFVQFERGEHERFTLHFSDDDAERGRRLIRIYNQYPTGDRTALDGRACYAIRGKDNRDKGKREAALEWFAERHYAKPGTNALLAKVGYEPVLPEREEA